MDKTNIELVPHTNQSTALFDFHFICSSSNGNIEIVEYIRCGKKYLLTAEIENGKKNGKGLMKDEDGGVIADLTYVDDELNGFAVLRNDKYQIIFKGMMLSGRKQGKCIEYDEKGRVVFHGYYDEDGNPHRLFEECKGKRGYYYEYSETDGRLLSLSEYAVVDEIRDGLSYLYDENGKVVKVSHFSKGVEDRLYCTVSEGDILREFDEKGKLIFESTLSKVNKVRICKEIDIRIVRGEELKSLHEWVYDHRKGNNRKKGFWIERLNGEMVSYSQYDGKAMQGDIITSGNMNVNKNGISFDFENGDCIRESLYANGEVQYVKRIFVNENNEGEKEKNGMKTMIEKDDYGNRVYEGEYGGDYLNGFVHEGFGKLYVNGEKIFEGHFHNDKREGYGTSFVNGYPHYCGEWHNDCAHGEGEIVMNNRDRDVRMKCRWENGYGYNEERNVYVDMNGDEIRGCMRKIRLTRVRMMSGLDNWCNGKVVNNGLFVVIILLIIFACLLTLSFYFAISKKHLIISNCDEYENLNWIDRYFVQVLLFDENCCNSSEQSFELVSR